MVIIKDVPPNFDKICKAFPFVRENFKSIVFTYGNILYAPGGDPVPEHLMVHEQTHQQQQGELVELWWDRYLKDSSFRLSQEVEAYRNQYMFFKETVSRQVAKAFLNTLAKNLSSKIYGNIIGFDLAREAIKYERAD